MGRGVAVEVEGALMKWRVQRGDSQGREFFVVMAWTEGGSQSTGGSVELTWAEGGGGQGTRGSIEVV